MNQTTWTVNVLTFWYHRHEHIDIHIKALAHRMLGTHTHMSTEKHFMMLERKKHKVETSSNCRWDNIKWSLLCVNYIESLQWSLVKWLTFLAFLISFWLPDFSVTLLLYRNSFWVKIFWFGQFDYGLWFSHRFSYRASVFCVLVPMYAYL